MPASNCLLLRLPLELRQQIYREFFPSPIPPDPTFHDPEDPEDPASHDLTDHLPAFHRLSNPRAEALCLAFPDLSLEITAEFRRNCTKLVFHARADEEWLSPPPEEEFKYLKLEEVEIIIETRSSPSDDMHLWILRWNVQDFTEFLSQNVKRVSLLRVAYELDHRIWWNEYIYTGGRYSGRKYLRPDCEVALSWVLSPLRKVRTVVLEVDIERPPGWEIAEVDMEEICDFHVKYPLQWDITREARREDAMREGVKFRDGEW